MTEFVKRLICFRHNTCIRAQRVIWNCVDMQWFRRETKIYMSANWRARRNNNNNFNEQSRCVVCACVPSIWILNFWIAYNLMYAQTSIWRNGASEWMKNWKKSAMLSFSLWSPSHCFFFHVRRTPMYATHKELFFMKMTFNQPTHHFHRVNATIDNHRSISSFILSELILNVASD